VKYQLAIGVLPISLMFTSFLPLWWLAAWLEAYLGIPANSPIMEHANGALLIVVLLVTMVSFMLAGYALGWFANAVVSRYFLGWSSQKVRAIYLHSDLPLSWLKASSGTPASSDAESISKWGAQRKVGAIRFIGVRGVLAWGGPMFLAMHVAPTVVKGQAFALGSTVLNLVLWACAGVTFGAAIWYISESNYRKLKQRSEATSQVGR
jgi:hypothetical protein